MDVLHTVSLKGSLIQANCLENESLHKQKLINFQVRQKTNTIYNPSKILGNQTEQWSKTCNDNIPVKLQYST